MPDAAVQPDGPAPTRNAQEAAPTVPPSAVCRRCLYSLQGLHADGRCSECSTPVAASLDPAWWGNAPALALRLASRLARIAAVAAALLLLARVSYWGLQLAGFSAVRMDTPLLAASIAALLMSIASPLASGVALNRAANLGTHTEPRLAHAAWGAFGFAGLSIFLALLRLVPAGVQGVRPIAWMMALSPIAYAAFLVLLGRGAAAAAGHTATQRLKLLGFAQTGLAVLCLIGSTPGIAMLINFSSPNPRLYGWWNTPLWLSSIITITHWASIVTQAAIFLLLAAELTTLRNARSTAA